MVVIGGLCIRCQDPHFSNASELRTPLTSIKSYIEAFQDGVLPADQENLSSIHEEIDRLVSLSSDLKDLNVAEMGALKLSLELVNLNHLLERIIHNLQPLIQEKELALNLNAPKEPVTTYGDKRLLTRLFYNLVHNAYQYTENGGLVAVTLTQTSTVTEVQILNTGACHERQLTNPSNRGQPFYLISEYLTYFIP